MLLIISCKSNQIEVVYYVPDIIFPTYPNPDNNVFYDEKNDEVRMKLSYYERIKNYKLEVDGIKNYYNYIKENVNENK